jgi:hypothetical protein
MHGFAFVFVAALLTSCASTQYRTWQGRLTALPKDATRQEVYRIFPPVEYPEPSGIITFVGIGSLGHEHYAIDSHYQISAIVLYTEPFPTSKSVKEFWKSRAPAAQLPADRFTQVEIAKRK